MSFTTQYDPKQSEEEAQKNALQYVCRSLKKREQLDTVDQMKRNAMHKKAFIEARLKTSVQNQLDNVKNGLDSLNNALTEIRDVKENMTSIDQQLDHIDGIKHSLGPLREINDAYLQLRTANTHLNNIINVLDICAETEQFINDGKLLLAHSNLMNLEQTRDDLLLQLHETNPDTQKNATLKEYFEPVMQLSDTFFKQISFILQRVLDTVRSDPKHLVTVLRIIEREDKIDKKAESTKFNKGFSAPGRPKRWKEKAKDIFKASINARFHMLGMDEEDDDQWLSDSLVKLEQAVLDELKCVKELCLPCFPPDFEIMEFYVHNYHKELVNMFEEISSRDISYSNIIVLLESLEHLKKHLAQPPLSLDIEAGGRLLPTEKKESMQKRFYDELRGKLTQLTRKIVDQEREEWFKNVEPEANINGHYHTAVSLILFEMVQAQIDMVRPLGLDMYLSVLGMCLVSMRDMMTSYRTEVRKYSNSVFQTTERETVSFCIPNLMACVNNSSILSEELEQLRGLILEGIQSDVLDEDTEKLYKEASASFLEVGKTACSCLLDFIFNDLESTFNALMTKHWIGKNEFIDTILVTIEDYSRELRSLRGGEFDKVMIEAQERVISEYIKAILDPKRSQFKASSKSERKKACNQLKSEAKKISQGFTEHSRRINPDRANIIKPLAEIIGLENDGMLALEVGSFAKSHNVKPGHIFQLLLVRGDVSRSQAKEICEDSRKINENISEEDRAKEDRRRRTENLRISRSYFGELPNIFEKVPDMPYQ